MGRHLIYLAFVNFLIFTLWGQAQNKEEQIRWSENYKLSWEDFKGNAPPFSKEAASTASGISYSYQATMKHFQIKVDCEVHSFFMPNDSWYNLEKANDAVLSHEQVHFDICEIFARKMRKRVAETTFSQTVKQEIKKIYKEILQELDNMQEQYDFETNHSRNKDKQKEWEDKVGRLLNETDNQ